VRTTGDEHNWGQFYDLGILYGKSPLTIESALEHVMAVKGTDCASFVRVPWNKAEVIKPVLDLAPAGIINPMVNTAEEANAAVLACRYPPAGSRPLE